jgi:nitric-oxide synthase
VVYKLANSTSIIIVMFVPCCASAILDKQTHSIMIDGMNELRTVPRPSCVPPTTHRVQHAARPVDPVSPTVAAGTAVVDPAEAEAFIRSFHAEHPDAGPVEARLRRVHAAIATTGTYTQTADELRFGAQVAWRNSSRCIGRLYWRSLRVRDRRHVHTSAGVFDELVAHVREATNGGRIRPTVTVFAPAPAGERGIRIWNEQLIRYAGYRRPDGGFVGDPRYAAFTATVTRMGWRGAGTPFDILPLVIETPGRAPVLRELPRADVLEVPIVHPTLPWFAELGLRWYALPAIANMRLECGGLSYQAAPFNGWYMGTEIGARNLADADRYDLLPEIGRRLGLDLASDRSLWKDRALVELNLAVLWSFDRAGVTVADHHSESRRFLLHVERENRAGRIAPADWAWIVPPISGAATAVFHRLYDEADLRPNFVHDEAANRLARDGLEHCPVSQGREGGQPVHSAVP